MIIITSIGRSGTSMMIEYLSKIGLSCQMGNWYSKLRAGYESADSMIINQSFIKHHNMRLSLDHVNYHRDKIKEISYDAVKDPLFVALPEIIEHWWNARQDLKVMLMTRPYEEIVKSQKAHPEMSTPTYRCFPELMEEKERQFIDKLEELKIPFGIFHYEALKVRGIYDWLGQYSKLPEFENCEKIWNDHYRTK